MALDALHTLPRADQSVRIGQTYEAVLRLLHYYAAMNGDIAEILSDMEDWPDVGALGLPNDPSAWSLWLDCLDNRQPLGSGTA